MQDKRCGHSCWVNLGHGIGYTSKKSQLRATSAGYFLTNSPSLLQADLGDIGFITLLADRLQRPLGKIWGPVENVHPSEDVWDRKVS